MGGPVIDATKIPAGTIGSPERQVAATSEAPAPSSDGIGAFRSRCAYSHMNFDDAIVFPNQPGRSHLHMYFGNTLANAGTTSPSTLRVPNARSTCRGGTANLSAYWTPALIDTRNGTPLRPTDEMDVYYKSGYGGVRPEQVRSIPKGLKLLAGIATSTRGQGRQVGQWGCSAESEYHFHDSIPACPAGAQLTMEVGFPQCLQVDAAGRPLVDSADHRSHAAYPDGGCPTSHPYAIPQVTFVVKWKIPAGANSSQLRLSSDMYSGGPGGYSLHGDYLEGWDDPVRDQFVANCSSKRLDCHSNLLGVGPDGRYQTLTWAAKYGQT
jgi:hypothetical protein